MQYTYSQVKNPKWFDKDNTLILCEVNFDHLHEEFVPFLADPNDIYPHSKEIFTRCLNGEFGVVKEYVYQATQYEDFIPVADVTPEQGV